MVRIPKPEQYTVSVYLARTERLRQIAAEAVQIRCQYIAKSLQIQCNIAANSAQNRCNFSAESLQGHCKIAANALENWCRVDAKSPQSSPGFVTEYLNFTARLSLVVQGRMPDVYIAALNTSRL